jgi:hypothetical protein
MPMQGISEFGSAKELFLPYNESINSHLQFTFVIG